MENRRRYYNILKKMNLQEEDVVNQALKNKGFYFGSDIYPLPNVMLFVDIVTIIRESIIILMK